MALFIFSNRAPREGERCSSRRLSRRPRRSTTHHLCASRPHRFSCYGKPAATIVRLWDGSVALHSELNATQVGLAAGRADLTGLHARVLTTTSSSRRSSAACRTTALVSDSSLFFLFVSVFLIRCMIYLIPFPDVVWICWIPLPDMVLDSSSGVRSLFYCAVMMRSMSKERGSPSAAESISESISG